MNKTEFMFAFLYCINISKLHLQTLDQGQSFKMV